jgi:hypothetical protein
MIRIYSLNRKVTPEKDEVSDANCMTLLGIGERVSKVSFLLTTEESQKFEDLTRDIESRIAAELLTAPMGQSEPEPKVAENAEAASA